MNTKNRNIYDHMTPDQLQNYTEMSGLTTWYDLDVIAQYTPLLTAQTVLDLGAGTGRAIEYLLQYGFTGTITAVERSSSFAKHLKKKFSDHITLIHNDMLAAEIESDSYDIALHLWAGFLEFSKQEQQQLMQKIFHALKPGGTYIIDIYTWISLIPKGRIIHNTITEGTLTGYLPTDREIEYYAHQAGFQDVDILTIFPKPTKPRNLYFLRK